MLLRTGTFGQRELFPRGAFTHESFRDKSGTRKPQFMVMIDDDEMMMMMMMTMMTMTMMLLLLLLMMMMMMMMMIWLTFLKSGRD